MSRAFGREGDGDEPLPEPPISAGCRPAQAIIGRAVGDTVPFQGAEAGIVSIEP